MCCDTRSCATRCCLHMPCCSRCKHTQLANAPKLYLGVDCKSSLFAGENIIVIVGGANTGKWDFSQETQQVRTFCTLRLAHALT